MYHHTSTSPYFPSELRHSQIQIQSHVDAITPSTRFNNLKIIKLNEFLFQIKYSFSNTIAMLQVFR